MCKKIILICGMLAVLMQSSIGLAANNFEYTHYSLGIEMSIWNKTSYSSANTSDLNYFRTQNNSGDLVIRKNRPGFNFFVTAQFIENLGMELGYGYIVKVIATAQNNNQASNKIQNLYLDFLGFLPVAERVNLIASVGVGMLKSSANVTNVTFADLDALEKVKSGFRFGGGASYTLNDKVSFRGMLRYQYGNKYFLTSNTSLSLGILYTF